MNPIPESPARLLDGNFTADARNPDLQLLNLDQNLRDICRWFGPGTVLIPIPRGQASPPGDAWKSTTLAKSLAPTHQAALWNSDVEQNEQAQEFSHQDANHAPTPANGQVWPGWGNFKSAET